MIEIYKKIEKTETNPHGFSKVESIPLDQPCIVIFGGTDTTNAQAANGYAKIFTQKGLLPTSHDKEIGIYSIVYDKDGPFGQARSVLFNKANGQNGGPSYMGDEWNKSIRYNGKGLSDSIFTEPPYINDIYNRLIAPKIKSDEKLPVHEICRRLRTMTFFAHCHGSYVVLKLEQKLLSELKKVGYSIEESTDILSQMVTISYTPAAPVAIAKSTIYSFFTADSSSFFRHNNMLFRFLRTALQPQNKEWLERFKKNRELEELRFYYKNTFFIEHLLTPDPNALFWSDKEHNTPNIFNENNKDFTDSGLIYAKLSKILLYNIVKNSLEQKNNFVPLPTIKELLSCDETKALFEELCTNGEKIVAEAIRLSKLWADHHHNSIK